MKTKRGARFFFWSWFGLFIRCATDCKMYNSYSVICPNKEFASLVNSSSFLLIEMLIKAFVVTKLCIEYVDYRFSLSIREV